VGRLKPGMKGKKTESKSGREDHGVKIERVSREVSQLMQWRDMVADKGLDVVITKHPSTGKRGLNTTWEIDERGGSREIANAEGLRCGKQRTM
jgi:hypothetical protein